jgi:hypothetical protein
LTTSKEGLISLNIMKKHKELTLERIVDYFNQLDGVNGFAKQIPNQDFFDIKDLYPNLENNLPRMVLIPSSFN